LPRLLLLSVPLTPATIGLARADATALEIAIDSADLFLATPVDLAVSVGWWANATGLFNVLNWKGKGGPYEPMWTLP
jgi:hypothetical protein